MADGEWQWGELLCFYTTICNGAHSVHLPFYPYKVIRWGCGGSNTVTVPRRVDYCASLAPSPVVRYASPPLPAAIPLPRLPIPALECFCSILNRLIEQCSRERAACQSQLKTQKQKIKKAHGWTPALIKKKKCWNLAWWREKGEENTPQMVNIYSPILLTENTRTHAGTHTRTLTHTHAHK